MLLWKCGGSRGKHGVASQECLKRQRVRRLNLFSKTVQNCTDIELTPLLFIYFFDQTGQRWGAVRVSTSCEGACGPLLFVPWWRSGASFPPTPTTPPLLFVGWEPFLVAFRRTARRDTGQRPAKGIKGVGCPTMFSSLAIAPHSSCPPVFHRANQRLACVWRGRERQGRG